jgi:hypothetical protein
MLSVVSASVFKSVEVVVVTVIFVIFVFALTKRSLLMISRETRRENKDKDHLDP